MVGDVTDIVIFLQFTLSNVETPIRQLRITMVYDQRVSLSRDGPKRCAMGNRQLQSQGRRTENRFPSFLPHSYGGFLSHGGKPSHHPFLLGHCQFRSFENTWGFPKIGLLLLVIIHL